jgi:hypothetical protein
VIVGNPNFYDTNDKSCDIGSIWGQIAHAHLGRIVRIVEGPNLSLLRYLGFAASMSEIDTFPASRS